MASVSEVFTPSVTWAQRTKTVFITINVPDVINPDIQVLEKSLIFKGRSQTEKRNYELKMKLFREIAPEGTKYGVRPRCIEIALEKVKEGPYWERLLEEKMKQHWLKIDFQKWKDEDESEESDDEAGTNHLKERLKLQKQMEGGPTIKHFTGEGGIHLQESLEKSKGLGDMPHNDLNIKISHDLDDVMISRICEVQLKNTKEPPLSKEKMDDEIDKAVKLKIELGQVIFEFHLEYSKKHAGDKLHCEKLENVRHELKLFSVMVSTNEMIETHLYYQIHEQTKYWLLKRWGMNLLKYQKFEHFLLNEPLHSIFEQSTEKSDQFQFQSMKNYNVPEWVYEFGETHVSIGCVDFQQLLLGKLDQSVLTFLGIDSSVVTMTRCKILYQMLKNQAEASSILQVWFSSAWTSKTQVEFQKALTNLLESNEMDFDEMDLLLHWNESKIDAEAAKKIWSSPFLKNECPDHHFQACTNLKYECDRVDYARYLFTGVIFADEAEIKYGNVTMFSIPENLLAKKVENENFFHTFNFNHSEFVYKGSLMKSVKGFMMRKTEELLELVNRGKVKMDFKILTIGLDMWSLVQLFRFVQGDPRTMDWSNISDFMSKEDFFKMVRHYKSKKTIHYVHTVNWGQCYKGASVWDYRDKMPVIRAAMNSFNLCHRELILASENYSQMWANTLRFMNYLDIIQWSLSKKCKDKYLNHFFGEKDVNLIIDPPNVGHWWFKRLHSVIYGRFSFV